MDDNTLQSLMNQHLTLQREEKELYTNLEGIIHRISLAFTKLTGLREVVVTPLASRYVLGDEGHAINGPSNATPLPPVPVLALQDPATCAQEQSCRLCLLLPALVLSENYVRRFVISSSPWTDLSPSFAKHYSIPGMSIWFFQLAKRPSFISQVKEAFGRIQELELDMCDNDHPDSDLVQAMRLADSFDSLSPIMAIFDELRVVNIRLRAQTNFMWTPLRTAPTLQKIFADKMYPHLRTVKVREMWLLPADFIEFLLRHQQTLQTVELMGVNLGGCEPDAGSPAQGLFVVGMLSTMSTGRDFPEWKQVVEACKTMPKLHGLRIEGASVGMGWYALGVYDMLELEETGMDGRENCFAAWSMTEMFDED